MAIGTETSKVSYTGDGVVTDFPVPFGFDAADLKVAYRPADADPEDDDTAWVEGANYTVTVAGSGGTVTAAAAPPVGSTVTIYRAPALVQLDAFSADEPFDGLKIEEALDKVVEQVQRVRDDVDRAPRFRHTAGVDFALEAPVPGAVLTVDETGLIGKWMDPPDTVIVGSQGYDLHCSFPVAPVEGEGVVFTIVRKMELPAALAGSMARCVTAPAAEQVFKIHAGATEIGTITFAIGATLGVIAGPASSVVMVPSDRLTIRLDSEQDPTMRDVSIALLGRSPVLSTIPASDFTAALAEHAETIADAVAAALALADGNLQALVDALMDSGSDVVAAFATALAGHGHALSDITGLVDALAGRAAAAHSHAQSDVTGLVEALSGKAASVHGHAIADVTGLEAALAAAGGTPEIADVVGLVAALTGKAASVHLHSVTVQTELAGTPYANTTTTYATMSQTFEYAAPSNGAACKVSVEVEGTTESPNGGGSDRGFLKLQVLVGASWTDVLVGGVAIEKFVGQVRAAGTAPASSRIDTFERHFTAVLSNAQQKTGGGFAVRIQGKIVDAGSTTRTRVITAEMAECA